MAISFLLLSSLSGVAVITKRPLNVLVLKWACSGFSFGELLCFLALYVGRQRMIIPGGLCSCACCTLSVVELQ